MAVRTIKEINDKYNYTDENPGGKGDAKLVSCAQCEGYNELQYIYDKKLKPLVEAEKITKDAAINALDKACSGVKNPRQRTDFYKHLSKTLDINIE